MITSTILVLAAILLVLFIAGFGTYKRFRKGGCCGNCAECGSCCNAPVRIEEEDD